jgi:hypothetical protein
VLTVGGVRIGLVHGDGARGTTIADVSGRPIVSHRDRAR